MQRLHEQIAQLQQQQKAQHLQLQQRQEQPELAPANQGEELQREIAQLQRQVALLQQQISQLQQQLVWLMMQQSNTHSMKQQPQQPAAAEEASAEAGHRVASVTNTKPEVVIVHCAT